MHKIKIKYFKYLQKYNKNKKFQIFAKIKILKIKYKNNK